MIDHQFNVRRYISVFHTTSEILVKEIDLRDFDLRIFQKALSVNDINNPLFDSFEITQDSIEVIRGYLTEEIQFNFKLYSYFLEAEKISSRD